MGRRECIKVRKPFGGDDSDGNHGGKIIMGNFFDEIKLPRLKKTDWIALALAGAILLMIAWPTEPKRNELPVEEIPNEVDSETTSSDYILSLEEKLEKLLGQMEGVGRVKVMITATDLGEMVVEKDVRTTNSNESEEETVYVKKSTDSYPYVGKEILPTIEGIVVVAEGGANATVATNISNAVMALFPIEAHKIIVVKMSSKGD